MFTKRASKFKQRQRPRPKSDDSGESSEENVEINRQIRRRRNDPNKQTSKKHYNDGSEDEADYRKMINLKYKSTMQSESAIDREKIATGGENPDLGPEVDIKDLTKRNDEIKKGLQDGSLDDNIYRGQGGYRSYHTIRSEAHTKESLSVKGPVRGNNFFRASVRIDHEPCICKDYKETGFCGFGDSCKFIHDRGDYKMGWQIEREFDQGTYDQTEEENWEVSSDEEDLPFKCIICRLHFQKPIVTKCAHYFCEDCALAHYKKSKRCFVCNKQTNGIFNMAKNIIAKLKHIDLKDVKIKDWEERIVGSDNDSDENEDKGGETFEMSEEEKAQLETERREKKARQLQHEKDLKTGKVLAEYTRNPMEDPVTSDDSDEPDSDDPDKKSREKALLSNYVADDLTNNIGKKQKEKTIKNEAEGTAFLHPAWSESSGSGSDGDIRDPTEYDPSILYQEEPTETYAQHTNPAAVADAINSAQHAIAKQQRIKEERKIQAEGEHHQFILEQKNELIDSLIKQEAHVDFIKEPNQFNSDSYEAKVEPDIKQELADTGPLLTKEIIKETTHDVFNTSVNVLTPSAGATFKPKLKPQRNASNNPLVKNIQHQARSQIPDKHKKKTKQEDLPVRSFLPNMNPYTHRQRDKEQTFNAPRGEMEPQVIPTTLPPLPIERKRPAAEELTEVTIQKKSKQPQVEEWGDLPENLMTIKSVSNKAMDWKKKS